jgi:hypothetical protein
MYCQHVALQQNQHVSYGPPASSKPLPTTALRLWQSMRELTLVPCLERPRPKVRWGGVYKGLIPGDTTPCLKPLGRGSNLRSPIFALQQRQRYPPNQLTAQSRQAQAPQSLRALVASGAMWPFRSSAPGANQLVHQGVVLASRDAAPPCSRAPPPALLPRRLQPSGSFRQVPEGAGSCGKL